MNGWTHLRVRPETKEALDRLMNLIEGTLKTGRDPGYFIAGRISVNSVLTHLINQDLARLDKRAKKADSSVSVLSADLTGPADQLADDQVEDPADQLAAVLGQFDDLVAETIRDERHGKRGTSNFTKALKP